MPAPRKREDGAETAARDAVAAADGHGEERARAAWWVPPALGLGAYLPAVVLLVGVLGFTDLWYGFFDVSDLPLYHAYATAMDRGFRPFVDFPAEYPPLALRLFAFPGHPSRPEAYVGVFAIGMLVALAVASVLVTAAAVRLWPGWRPAARSAATFALSVLALGAIVANRFDALVALLLAGFLWAVASRRWLLAGLALGLGTALKLTPLILLPLPLMLATEGRSRARVLFAFAAAAVVPFAVEGPVAWDALQSVFRFHGQRPLQAESPLGTPLLLAHLAGLLPAQMGHAYGSHFIDAPGAPSLAHASGPLAAALLLLVYGLAWWRRQELRADPSRLALVAVAALLAFLVPAKVLSPQFLVWLLPAVALLAVPSAGLAALLVAVILLTQLEFPARYYELVALRPAAVLIVAARNLGLLAALIWALLLLAGLRIGPARGVRWHRGRNTTVT